MTGLSLEDTERALSEGMNQEGGKRAPSPAHMEVSRVWFGAPGTCGDPVPEIDDANLQFILRVQCSNLSISVEQKDESLKNIKSSSGGSTSERDHRGYLRVLKFSLLDCLGKIQCMMNISCASFLILTFMTGRWDVLKLDETYSLFVFQFTSYPILTVSKERESNAKGRPAMETQKICMDNPIGRMLLSGTEGRLQVLTAEASIFITTGSDSLCSFQKNIELLKGLDPNWPTSVTANEMDDHSNLTLTLLGNKHDIPLIDVDPNIRIGTCCTLAAHCFSRCLRHLLLVRYTVEKELKDLLAEEAQDRNEYLISKIAIYRHFLKWLATVLDRLGHSRDMALKKVASHHGELAGDLKALEGCNDSPRKIKGVCAGCDQEAEICPETGCVCVNGEPHLTCIPFGNRLAERLEADRVRRLIFDTLGTTDHASVCAFLKRIADDDDFVRPEDQPREPWLNSALRAVCQGDDTTDDMDVLSSHLSIKCPVCGSLVMLSTDGKIYSNLPGEEHICASVSPLSMLQTALTPSGHKPPSPPQPEGGSVGTDEDKALILGRRLETKIRSLVKYCILNEC